MKHIVTFVLAVLLFPFVSVAAGNVQKGYVKTIGRPERKGQPIYGATVRLSGEKNAVVSDSVGEFELLMHDKKEGDGFYISKVNKLGYRWINNSGTGQEYAYSASVSVMLSMISNAELDEIAFAIAENNRARNQESYEKKLAELEEQLRQSKLSVEDYRSQLADLQQKKTDYDALIDELAEQYAMIDYDTLDSLDREISYCIERGELERADSLVRSKGSLEERHNDIVKFVAENKKLEAVVAKRNETANRKITELANDYYVLHTTALSKFENDSAAHYLELRASLDTTNVRWQIEAGSFIDEYIADYDKALGYYYRALDYAKAHEGEENDDVAALYNNIGKSIAEQDRFDESMSYFQKALDLKIKIFGETSIELAECYTNMGSVYKETEEYDMALKCFKKALELRENSDEVEPDDLALSYNNIGSIYAAKDDNEKALEYYFKALSIVQEAYKKAHESIALEYNNIGMVYYSMGEFKNSLEYLSKAQEMFVQVYGDNHPKSATILKNMAVVNAELSDFKSAITNVTKALNIEISIYGENHASVAMSYNNLATYYFHIGDVEVAEGIQNKALDINKKIYGEHHESVAVGYINLGHLNDQYKKYDEALTYYQKAYEILSSYQDVPYRRMGNLLNNMGGTYIEKEDYEQAINCYDEALKMYSAIYDKNHPDIAMINMNVGALYSRMGEYEKSEQYFNDALQIFKAVYGEINERVATCYNNMGTLYYGMGNINLAIENYTRALSIHDSIFAADNFNKAELCNSLGVVSYEQNDLKGAKNYFARAFNWYKDNLGANHPETNNVMMFILDCYNKLCKSDTVDAGIKKEFDEMLTHVVFAIEVVPGETPAAKQGLSGVYYLVRYNDWDMESEQFLYDYIPVVANSPKTLLLMKDNVITEHQFELKIGCQFSVIWVEPEAKQAVMNAYHDWKSKNAEN